MERLGGETYLYVNTEKNEELTVHAAGDKVVGVGDLVSIGFATKHCHLFNGQGKFFEKSELVIIELEFSFANPDDIPHMVVDSVRINLLKSMFTDIISNAYFKECRCSHST